MIEVGFTVEKLAGPPGKKRNDDKENLLNLF
jgi:hypothetical protein